MIRHIVLTKFKPETSEEAIAQIYNSLAALTEKLEGAQNFCGGRSQSPEHMELGYMHGFTIDFTSWDALKEYADHDEHKALGLQLIDKTLDGLNGILVLDIAI